MSEQQTKSVSYKIYEDLVSILLSVTSSIRSLPNLRTELEERKLYDPNNFKIICEQLEEVNKTSIKLLSTLKYFSSKDFEYVEEATKENKNGSDDNQIV